MPQKKNKKLQPIQKQLLPADISEETLHTFYREMLLIRRFEEKAGQLYGMGKIGGFCHLYIGQEAVITGVQSSLSDGDSVITGYRCHGHMLSAGASPKEVMAELTGKVAGVSQGKGGSMHMFVRGKFYGGHGIVGAQVPLGTGLAFANKYNGNDRVTVTFFGDGAANQGQVFEAFNMAALWKLPVIYVIENNQYAMGTALSRSTAIEELYRRGAAFGIDGQRVDGMDVLEVKRVTEAAVSKCRLGEGPILLELMTYRYRGHSMSDPAKYRSKEKVHKVRDERDPIENLKKLIVDSGYKTEEDLKKEDKSIRSMISEAAEFAQMSPEPDPSALTTDIYMDDRWVDRKNV